MTDEMNLPLFERKLSQIIKVDGVDMQFNTSTADRIGHKITDSKGMTVNAFYILYRSPGHRYFVYDHKNIPGADKLIQGPEINLKSISKKEAQELYEGLDSKQASFAEAFNQIADC